MNRVSKHPIELHAGKARWLKKYLTAKSEAEKQFIKIHAETSLSRIWQHLQNPDMVVGFILRAVKPRHSCRGYKAPTNT